MIVKKRRGTIVATSTRDVHDLVTVLRSMEKDTVIRLFVEHVAWPVPLKALCDIQGISIRTYTRTLENFKWRISDIHREVK